MSKAKTKALRKYIELVDGGLGSLLQVLINKGVVTMAEIEQEYGRSILTKASKEFEEHTE